MYNIQTKSTVGKKGKITKAQLGEKLIEEILNTHCNGSSAILNLDKFTTTIENNRQSIILDSGWDLTKNSLLVFKNGIYLELDLDYSLSYSGNIVIPIEGVWEGSTIEPTIFNFVLIDENSSLIEIHKDTSMISFNVARVPIRTIQQNRDYMFVFKNGIYLEEGRDYVINSDSTISSIEGTWETYGDDNTIFNFIYLSKSSSIVDVKIKKEDILIESNTIKIFMDYYDRSKDDLLLFLNGIYYEEGYDYIIGTDNSIMRPDFTHWSLDGGPIHVNILYVSRNKSDGGHTTDDQIFTHSSTNMDFDQNVFTFDGSIGKCFINVNHNLNSKKVVLSVIDSDTMMSVPFEYKLVDSDTAVIYVASPRNINVTVINTSLGVKENIPETITSYNISSKDWDYIEDKESYCVDLHHNLSSNDLLISAYDDKTNESIAISSNQLDSNILRVTTKELYNVKLIIAHKSALGNNSFIQLNDQIQSVDTTYSSNKIVSLIEDVNLKIEHVQNEMQNDCFDPRRTVEINELLCQQVTDLRDANIRQEARISKLEDMIIEILNR